MLSRCWSHLRGAECLPCAVAPTGDRSPFLGEDECSRERPGAAGVTQEHPLRRQNASFAGVAPGFSPDPMPYRVDGSHGAGAVNGVNGLSREERDRGRDGRCDWACDSITEMRSRSDAAQSGYARGRPRFPVAGDLVVAPMLSSAPVSVRSPLPRAFTGPVPSSCSWPSAPTVLRASMCGPRWPLRFSTWACGRCGPGRGRGGRAPVLRDNGA